MSLSQTRPDDAEAEGEEAQEEDVGRENENDNQNEAEDENNAAGEEEEEESKQNNNNNNNEGEVGVDGKDSNVVDEEQEQAESQQQQQQQLQKQQREGQGSGEEEKKKECKEEKKEEGDEKGKEESEMTKPKKKKKKKKCGKKNEKNQKKKKKKKKEFIVVRLADIRKEVQCPICLGIIRKTRTVMECLHRFCRECIDKSMRLGNNECPACRTHCASRRSLRDDPNYDALIDALYPDIDQYEEEELAFQDDEKDRNKQIQAAIAETFYRQTEALSKKRKRSHITYRRRRNYRTEEDDDANVQDAGRDSSSADERSTEVKMKGPKRLKGQPSPATASGDGGGEENDQEEQRVSPPAPAGLIGSAEVLAWGKGGMRSQTRHGSGSTGNSKHARGRVARLGEHLRNLNENDDELDIHVVLVPLNEQTVPVLHYPYLIVGPTLSVRQICQLIAIQVSLPAEGIEVLAAKYPDKISGASALGTCKDDLEVLDSNETLAGVKAGCHFSNGKLMLAYRWQNLTA